MSEMKYTNDHECVLVQGDVALVGITKYAQEALGDLVFIELPDVGANFSKGDDMAVVESVKTAAEVYTPVDGEVVEANEAMAEDLEMISKPLADGGWIAKIKMSDASQLEALMDETSYSEYVGTLD